MDSEAFTIFSTLFPPPMGGSWYYLTAAAQGQTARERFDEGLRLKQLGKSKEALLKFQQSEKLKPGYTDALYEQARCYNDLKEYNNAVSVLRKVVPVWAEAPKGYYEMAFAMQYLGTTDSALYYYSKTLELNPDFADVYRQLGYMSINNRQYEHAMACFKKYESYLNSPQTDYLYLYWKGYLYNVTKDYVSAREALLQCLSIEPDYEPAYLELGFASSRSKQEDQAIEYYRKAIALNPKSHIGYNGIGEVYRDYKKDMNEAMNWYMRALQVKPDERKALFGIGYCLNAKKEYKEAVGYLKKAIAAEDTYTAAYVDLGFSYYMLNDNEEAVRNLNLALRISPQNAKARYYKGLVYLDINDKYSAQRMVDELKDLKSGLAATLQEKMNKK